MRIKEKKLVGFSTFNFVSIFFSYVFSVGAEDITAPGPWAIRMKSF
jgi:hypothetical protein